MEVNEYQAGLLLLADQDAQSSQNIPIDDIVEGLAGVLKGHEDGKYEIKQLSAQAEVDDGNWDKVGGPSILSTGSVETEHGSIEIERSINGNRIVSCLDALESERQKTRPYNQYEDEITDAGESILENVNELILSDIEDLSTSIPNWEDTGEATENILEITDSLENDTHTDEYNTEMAEMVLETEYTRENYVEELENIKTTEGQLSGMVESIIASEATSIWKNPQRGDVMVQDEEDGHEQIAEKGSKIAQEFEKIEEKVERLWDRDDSDSLLQKQITEAKETYGSQADYLGAIFQLGVSGNMNEEMEEYLWKEYIPQELQYLDDFKEIRHTGRNLLGAIKSHINERNATEIYGLLEEGDNHAEGIKSQIEDQPDYEEHFKPSDTSVEEADDEEGEYNLVSDMYERVKGLIN